MTNAVRRVSRKARKKRDRPSSFRRIRVFYEHVPARAPLSLVAILIRSAVLGLARVESHRGLVPAGNFFFGSDATPEVTRFSRPGTALRACRAGYTRA